MRVESLRGRARNGRARGRLLIAIAAVAAGMARSPAHAALEKILATGDAAPGLQAGTTVGLIANPNFFGAQINAAGQVPVQFTLSGSGVNTSNDSAFWLGTPGDVDLLLREGSAANGAGAGVVFGDVFSSSLNDLGQVLFKASLAGTGVTASTDKSLWRINGDASGALLIAREGSSAPGTGVSYDDVFLGGRGKINNNGDVAFESGLTGASITTSNDRGIWAGPPGTTDFGLVLREGSAAPGAGANVGDILLVIDFNNLSQLGMRVPLVGASSGYAGARGNLSLLARSGDPAPGLPAGVNIGTLSIDPRVNDAGETIYTVGLSGNVTTANDRAIYQGPIGSPTLLIREGDAAPGAPGLTVGVLSGPGITNSGILSFTGDLAGSGITSQNDDAIWAGTPGNIKLIARGGAAAPGMQPGVVFTTLSGPTVSEGFQVGFTAFMSGPGITGPNAQGYWLTDGNSGETMLVMREGDNLDGRTIGEISSSGVNNSAQVAFKIDFTNGDQGVYLFTPDIHWKSSGSGNWDTAGNWTLGLDPGRVHPVTIDPAASLTVTGPAGETTVRSLALGGGFGTPTLRTASGGQLNIVQSLILATNGSLDHRSGTIDVPFVINEGNIDVGAAMNVSGNLANQGSLDILAGGRLNLSNGMRNDRLMTIAGGAISGSGEFVNNHGATLQANGSILVTFVTNRGTIELTGVLTWDDLINEGTVRIGAGETVSTFAGSQDRNSGLIEISGGGYNSFGGSLENLAAGTLRGFGTIALPFDNGGGVVHATGGVLTISTFSGNRLGGELRVDDDATLNITSNFNSSGSTVLRGEDASLAGGVLSNTGSLSGRGRVANRVLNNGEIRAIDGRLTLSASGNTNPSAGFGSAAGLIVAENNAEVFFSQGLATNGGQIVLLGGSFHNNGKALSNSGVIDGHGVLRTGALTNSNRGTISVGGGDLDVLGNVVNSAGATISVQKGRTIRFFNDVSGAGSFAGTGTVEFLAGFSPGASPGVVGFDGDLRLADSAGLMIELGGDAPGPNGFDQLRIGEQAWLGGWLRVELLDGYDPPAGTGYDIIVARSIDGEFLGIDGPDFADGRFLMGMTLREQNRDVYRLVVVPEPAWMSGGLALLSLGRRRRTSELKPIRFTDFCAERSTY